MLKMQFAQKTIMGKLNFLGNASSAATKHIAIFMQLFLIPVIFKS